MKKGNSSTSASSSLDSLLLNSPPRNHSIKHSDLTPLKKQNKTSKCKEEADVHSASSSIPPLTRTEASPPHMVICPYSPYSSSCSEDSAPEVVWDYTSPKHPSGAARPERKMTIADLLNNINYEVPKHNSHSLYDELLEDWTITGKDCFSPKQEKKTTRKPKRNAQYFEEMLKLLESFASKDCISGAKQDITKLSEKEVPEANVIVNNCKESCELTEVESVKDIIHKDDSCINELWGDASQDERFVKATQCLEDNKANNSKAIIVESTVYGNNDSIVAETLISPLKKQTFNCSPKKDAFFDFSKKKCDACECHSDIKDNFHRFEHDFCSTKPFNYSSSFCDKSINCGSLFNKLPDPKTVKEQKYTSLNSSVESRSVECKDDNVTMSYVNQGNNSTGFYHSTSVRRKECVEKILDLEFDTFHEDDLFEPETLMLLDKIESEVSIHQVCSAEEIAKKKQEAIRRRKQCQLRKEIQLGSQTEIMHQRLSKS